MCHGVVLAATPAQILVRKALGGGEVVHCHIPLVVGPDGKRLAKRHGDTRISSFRAAGVPPQVVVGRLAATCGWGDGSPCTLQELLSVFTLETIPRHAVQIAM